MAELITVPTFCFEQGDIFACDGSSCERPINVQYYNGSFCLEQGGNEIIILPEYFEAFVKEIRKHKKDAEYFINKKQ